MADTPRDELAELARMLSAHLEWQRELGAAGLPGGSGPRAGASFGVEATASPSAGASLEGVTPGAGSRAEAPTRFEVPGFLRRGAARPAPPAPTRSPAIVPAPAEPAAPAMIAPPRPAAITPAPAAPAAPAGQRALPVLTPQPDAPLDGAARVAALAALAAQAAGCTRCRLSEQRTHTVFARGNPHAALAFVGEGPGRDEDLQGRPFVGAAGQLLDKIIAAMGLCEDDVYICNVVKCRPPNNRVPAPDEMGACSAYLDRQLSLVRPSVIVALGKTAAGHLLGSSDAMSRLRGRWFERGGVPVLPTWHPAYLLRDPNAKRDTWEDMKLVLQKLGRAAPARGGGQR